MNRKKSKVQGPKSKVKTPDRREDGVKCKMKKVV